MRHSVPEEDPKLQTTLTDSLWMIWRKTWELPTSTWETAPQKHRQQTMRTIYSTPSLQNRKTIRKDLPRRWEMQISASGMTETRLFEQQRLTTLRSTLLIQIRCREEANLWTQEKQISQLAQQLQMVGSLQRQLQSSSSLGQTKTSRNRERRTWAKWKRWRRAILSWGRKRKLDLTQRIRLSLMRRRQTIRELLQIYRERTSSWEARSR